MGLVVKFSTMYMCPGDLSYAGLSQCILEPLHIDKEDEFEHIWDLLGTKSASGCKSTLDGNKRKP